MVYAAVNGLNMYDEVTAKGPPLLLLHGGASPIPEKWIPFFSPRFRVIAMEQMGHGRTADIVPGAQRAWFRSPPTEVMPKETVLTFLQEEVTPEK